MNKLHLLSLVSGLALVGNVTAGSAPAASGKGVVAPVTTPESTSMWSGSVTLGYDSSYVYRGVEVLSAAGEKADHLVSGAIDINGALTDKLTLNANAWYASAADADYDELDLYTRLSYNAGPITFGPSFKYYHYPRYGSAIDNQYEVGLEISSSPVEGLTLGLGGFYEFEAEQWYYQATAEYTVKLCDMSSIVIGGVISYLDADQSNFWATSDSDFHHAGVYVRVPIKLSNTVTLAPYIAANFPLGDQIDGARGLNQDDIIYGGATLSVSF